MFGLKRKTDPRVAADDFVLATFGMAGQTFPEFVRVLSYVSGMMSRSDSDWFAAFLDSQDTRRPLHRQWAAALIAQEAMGIRVCLEEPQATAVLGAVFRRLEELGPEVVWMPSTVARYMTAQSERQSMYDNPIVDALLTEIGFRDEPKLAPLIGHMVWSLPLAEVLLNSTQGYWKQFAANSRIKV